MIKSGKSIRWQIFIALLAVSLLMAAMFSPYGCYTNIKSIRKSVDERLRTAVYGVKEIISPDYHDRLKAGKVSQEEYAQLQQRLVDYTRKINISFLYALVKDENGKICFSLDSSAEKMSEYKKPSIDTFIVFSTKKETCMQTPDEENGIVSRTVMIPFYTTEGNFYVIGADLNRSYLRASIERAILDFFVLVGIGGILVLILTFYLSRRISAPIKNLSKFTELLANSNFDESLKMPKSLLEINSANEVATLAESVELMREKLDEHIKNLAKATREKERVASELKIAGQIQQSFLPQNSFSEQSAKIFAAQKSAKEAGGDLYDFFVLQDGRLCVSIGDVSGKGMPAAIFMARAMTLIRSSAQMTSSIKEMVEIINDQLCRNNDSCMFVTFLICAYDFKTRKLTFVNCGHNPPLLRKRGGRTRYLKFNPNKILGVFEALKFEKDTIVLDDGDKLLFYTDGVNEAGAPDGSFFGDERLQSIVANADDSSSPKEIVEKIMDSVTEFESGVEQSDDITIVALEVD